MNGPPIATIKPRSRPPLFPRPSAAVLPPVASAAGGTHGLDAYIGPWVAALADDGKEPKTLSLYAYTVRGWLKWQGSQPLTKGSLHSYVRYLQVEHRPVAANHAGLRPRTIRRMFTALRSFFSYVRLQGVEVPAIETVSLPRMDTARREVHTDPQVRAMFTAATRIGRQAGTAQWREWQRARACCILALLAGCALRRGELLALDVSDVREEAGGWVCCVRRGKMGSARQMPIAPEHHATISDWLRVRLERAQRLNHTSEALFMEEKGHRLGNVGLMNLWHALLTEAGIEDTGLTPHGLRHWAATSILRTRSAKVAQVFLGHRSVMTTLEVYAHATSEDMREAADGLAGTIANRPAVAPVVLTVAPKAAGAAHKETMRQARRRTRQAGRRGRL